MESILSGLSSAGSKLLSVAKEASPVNKLLLPGQLTAPSYDVSGSPFAGRRVLDGASYDLSLSWIPSDIRGGQEANQEPTPMLVVRREDQTRFVMIHLHGNACDVGQMSEDALQWAHAFQSHVIMPEFPGFGVSPGSATEDSINAAAQLAADVAIQALKVPAERIIVFGRSVGTGPAAQLAATLSTKYGELAALVLMSAYTDFRALAHDLAGLVGMVAIQRWNTAEALEDVLCPILLLHGTSDEIIPFKHSETLYANRARYKKECVLYRQVGATHNRFNSHEDVIEPIASMLSTRAGAGSAAVACDFEALGSVAVGPPDDLQKSLGNMALEGAGALLATSVAASTSAIGASKNAMAASVAASVTAVETSKSCMGYRDPF